MDLEECREIAKMGWPENQKAQRQHDAVDWLISEYEANGDLMGRLQQAYETKRAEMESLTSLCANYGEALTAVQRFEGVIYGAGGIGAIDLLNKALEADKALQAEKEGE